MTQGSSSKHSTRRERPRRVLLFLLPFLVLGAGGTNLPKAGEVFNIGNACLSPYASELPRIVRIWEVFGLQPCQLPPEKKPLDGVVVVYSFS